jgi:hypothetical protein
VIFRCHRHGGARHASGEAAMIVEPLRLEMG